MSFPLNSIQITVKKIHKNDIAKIDLRTILEPERSLILEEYQAHHMTNHLSEVYINDENLIKFSIHRHLV